MERDPYCYGVWLSAVTAIFMVMLDYVRTIMVCLDCGVRCKPILYVVVSEELQVRICLGFLSLTCCAQEVRIPCSGERKNCTN
jgi:hypothetical protein